MARVRVLLIGESPSATMPPGARAFDGLSGRRLASLVGIPHGELWDYFEAVNVFDHHVPHRLWSARAARVRYFSKLAPLEFGYQVVLLCGWRVAAAAECSARSYLSVQSRRCVDRYVLPHPSGKNQWYNLPENREAASRFLRGVLQMD